MRRAEELRRTADDTVYDEKLRERLEGMLAQHYGHEEAAGMPGKLSVSELKHAAYEAEMERLEEERDAMRLEDVIGSRRASAVPPEAQSGGTGHGRQGGYPGPGVSSGER